ncbi:LamG domain-containing protein [Amycolatopsis xylanica]|nr:LamG domain-containing protein [Amycolatopsis xylanica]
MLLVVLAVAFGVLPATAFPGQDVAAAAVPDVAPDSVTASKFAKQSQKSVRVMDQTTETDETVANPNGSFTRTRHTRPVRVKQNGTWVRPDSTLVQTDAGVLAPKAATTDITLSRGRSGSAKSANAQPLLSLTQDGTATGFDWPGALPAAVVTGSTATYPEILPGVDLKLEVDIDTVHEVVVVKTAEAAKNPALAKLGFTIPVRQGTVTKDADGTLHVRDTAGTEKFTAPPAIMWDSSGTDAANHNFLRGPAPGGRRAPVGEELSGTKLTLSPDQTMFAGADTVFPVYVDPEWHDNYCTSCNRNHYLVQYACGSGKTPGDVQWDNDDQLRAGYVNDTRTNCHGSHLVTARSFVELGLSGLEGTLIYDAVLNLNVINSETCGPANNVVLANGIDSGMAFNSGPGWGETLGTVDGCSSNVSFVVTPTIASLVNNGESAFTFGIVAPNENDLHSWKRYTTDVGFTVTYNSPPNKPANLQLFNGSQGFRCVRGASRPVLGRISTAYVAKANVSDPDGYELYAGFRVYKGLVSTGKYTWDGNETGVDNVLSDEDTNNRNAVATLPQSLMNADGFYSWDVHTTDGKETAWSAGCEVEVELSAPAKPAVASQTYPSGTFGGGPGRPGDFTFSVANSPTTVGHYVWKLDNTASPACNGTEPGTVKPVAFNGPATTAIAPQSKGPHVLSVWSCNRAATASSRTDYTFNVKDASAPVASWQLEGTGTSQATGLRYAGQGMGNFGAGKLGQAATLTSQAGDYFATSARVLDTTASFSVSAWVNPADLTGRRAVLSQDGGQTSGFVVQYLETGKWAFSVSSADTANPQTASALSAAPATANAWTHLTAVYDAGAHTASLYVNGQAQSTVAATTWNSSGPLVLGGAKVSGSRGYLLKGALDEIAVFDRALPAADVNTLYTHNGVPTGLSAIREYTVDGVTTDATGTDETLTFGNGVTYTPGYTNASGQSATDSSVGQSSGQGISVTGSAGARSKNPVVDTAQSFTVSAWAKLSDTDGYYAVFGQEGSHASGFQLRYSHDSNRWIMGMPSADTDADTYRWTASTSIPQAGVWTHLTGVYDASTSKILLYVNGVLEGQIAIPAGSVWNATGGFTIGQIRARGLPDAFFRGSIDQVQVWDRTLPADEIAGLANSAVLRANYQLDGSTLDKVSGASGVSSGAVTMTTDSDGAPVARFGKDASGQIEGPRPQNLRSDRSFTVEAWVKHAWTDADIAAAKQADPAKNPSGVDKPGRAAVGVNSPQFSPYMLGYRGITDSNGVWHPRWSWLVTDPSATQANPLGKFSVSDVDAESNVWTHLTGTYDAITHTACLYAATDSYQYAPTCLTGVTGWNGASALEDLFLGSGEWNGYHADFWYGDLRGVRLYSGVLDAQHINADAIVDHP